MRCPTCGGEMSQVEAQHVEVDMCTNCGGIWLDETEFEELLGTIRCPRCQQMMQLRELRGVEYDICPGCGSVWLDRGELGQMVDREPLEVERRSHLHRFLDDTDLARNLYLVRTHSIGGLDTDDPIIDEIFLVHQTGTLVAHATRRLKPDTDDTLLSAMLVAIQSFVQESFKDEGDSRLKEVAFGQRRILLEKSEHMLLAVVVSEDVEQDPHDLDRTRGTMKEVVLQVEDQFEDVLKEWDGFVERFRGARDIISRIFK